ncbi:MAG: DNA repair exonuclease [Firmicutes bacterium]|nr:DNA repair exonuclease [Bacillota bacterium]
MTLKILHTGDLHIGMRYGGYPEHVRTHLAEARVDVLRRLVAEANNRQCDLFVIAGDLFTTHKPKNSLIVEVTEIIKQFAGACTLILPGNHDYTDALSELWQTFVTHKGENTILLEDAARFSLDAFGLSVEIWPAPCTSLHSETNNLGWMHGQQADSERFNIGIAHGSVRGLSPDLDNSYFPMEVAELRALPPDLWLLGHSHVRYPDQNQVTGEQIFNAGTPEPDGLDCRHRGHAWIITVDAAGKVSAESTTCGQYRFMDLSYQLTKDFSVLEQELLTADADKSIARLTLTGNLPAEVLAERQNIYRKLAETLLHVDIRDSRLGLRLTPTMLDKEFTAGSFPHRLLKKLTADGEAMQIAYQLIKEVK